MPSAQGIYSHGMANLLPTQPAFFQGITHGLGMFYSRVASSLDEIVIEVRNNATLIDNSQRVGTENIDPMHLLGGKGTTTQTPRHALTSPFGIAPACLEDKLFETTSMAG